MIPIYLKYISIETYGTWLATGNILVWITAMDPGLSAVLQQQVAVAYGKIDKNSIGKMVVGSLFITTIIVCLIFGLGIVIGEYLPTLLNIRQMTDINTIMDAFLLALIGTSLMIFSYSIISINKGMLSSIGVGIIGLVVSLLAILSTLALLYNDYGLLAIPIGLIVRGAGFIMGNMGYLLWRLRREGIQISFSFKIVKKLIMLISYTFFGKIGSVVANNMDLFVISRYLGPEIVTMFSITKKAPEISRTFVERPPVAFMPAVSHLWGAGEIKKAKSILLRLLRILIWISGIIVGSFAIFNDDFVALWVGENLYAGFRVNVIICVAILLAMTTNSLANLCFALGNIRGNSITTFIQSLMTAVFVLLGAKYFGLLGVVFAPVISMLAVSSWYYPKMLSRLLNMDKHEKTEILKEILKVFVIILPLSSLFFMLSLNSWFMFVLMVLSYCTLYILGLYSISDGLNFEVRIIVAIIADRYNKLKAFRDL